MRSDSFEAASPIPLVGSPRLHRSGAFSPKVSDSERRAQLEHRSCEEKNSVCQVRSQKLYSLWLNYDLKISTQFLRLNPPAPVGAKGVFPEALATGSFSWGGGRLFMQAKRMVRS